MIYDCIVIGAGPAGLTAGLYLCRAGYFVAIVTGYTGNMSIISKIDNYPGIVNVSGQDILDVMMTQCKDAGATIIESEVIKAENDNGIYRVFLDDSSDIESICIIDATGGRHKELGIAGEEKWLNNGISFCATCDGPMCEGKDVVVIGGGNSAISSAIELAKYCSRVHVIYRKNEFSRVEKPLLNKMGTASNIVCHMNSNVVEFIGEDELNGVLTDANERIDAYMVFYCIGFEENSIEVIDENEFYMKAGDNVTEFKQAIIAAGSGASTAMKMIEKLKRLENK